MNLSVVIPAYNEERVIGEIVDRVRKVVDSDAEVIVVDDGSKDNTAKRAAEKGAKIIQHTTNQGKGVSIRDGFASANADFVLFIDGDGQDDPADIPRLLQPMTQGADFVIGSRWLGVLRDGAISETNFLVSDMITRLINLLYNSNITDSQAGFRCVRKRKLEKLKFSARGYDIETEMLLKAIKHKLRIVEVPVTRSRRPYGTTHMKRYRLGVKILLLMLKEVFTS